MLTDPSGDIQAAIRALLLADPDVKSLVDDRIFDRIENVPEFPYITIGEAQVIPELGEGTDAAESNITIHTWSRFKTFNPVKNLGKIIIRLLHDGELTISDGIVQSMLLESVRYLRDPDGLTSHGVLTFNILTDAS